MGRNPRRGPLIAVTAGLLALGSGCLTSDKQTNANTSKKPDVTQPGVLPPPQDMGRAAGSGVVPAGGVAPGTFGGPAAPAPTVSPLAKLTGKHEKKIPATEMATAWQNRIAYLPDPTRNGAMCPGLVGQLFLFGGPNLAFAQVDGTVTIDVIDESPRPVGQPAATPERWQFTKEVLRNLKANDETFGKSYVLFLPWPSYKPDITRVRIAVRYDPDNGHTLFATPSTVTIDTTAPMGAPVWSQPKPGSEPAPGYVQPQAQPQPQPLPQSQPPIPIPPRNSFPVQPQPFPVQPQPQPQPGAMMPMPGVAPASGAMLPLPVPIPSAAPMPGTPVGPQSPMPGTPVGPHSPMPGVPVMPVAPAGGAVPGPAGAMPLAPSPPTDVAPLMMVLPSRQ